MKKSVILLIFVFVMGIITTNSQTIIENTKLKITVNGREIFATLYDNATTRSFIRQLPLNITLSDYANTEKIFYPPQSLETQGVVGGGVDPQTGAITCYAPWGNIAIFYRSFSYSNSLIPIGQIEDNGVQILQVPGSLEAKFELVTLEEPLEQEILILYYTRTGNTRTIANYIHEITGGIMTELHTVNSYPSDYNEILEQVQNELNSGYLPEIQPIIQNLDNFDTIFIGHPLWWGHVPPPVQTFLSENDLSGKTIIQFCTYGSSGLSSSRADFERLCPNSTLLESYGTRASTVNNVFDEVGVWLERIGIMDASDDPGDPEDPENPVSINDIQEDGDLIKVHVRKDFLTVEGNIKQLTLININGSIVARSNNSQMFIGNLASGVYILRIEYVNNKTVARKIIKR